MFRDTLERLLGNDELSDHAQLLDGVPEPHDAVAVAHFIAVGLGRSATWNSSKEGRKIVRRAIKQMFQHLCQPAKHHPVLEPEECSDHAKPGVEHMPFCHDFK